jgi:hypothetical protein
VYYTIFLNNEIVLPIAHDPLASAEEDQGWGVGYILGLRVPPPRTFKSLKRSICKAEQIEDPDAFEMYGTADEDEAFDEAQKIQLNSGQYPGANPDEPIVLVNKESATIALKARVKPSRGNVDKPLRRVFHGKGRWTRFPTI